ncbi:MAG: transglycosylase domain-containing protein, partial [Acidobacteria bacterium]|nr:transglycosylase domain-containing protein [Acidobacteriota bacterium]
STITQQLVKNILVGSERSYRRKFREAFLSLALERRFTKEQIFTRYANTIYLGRRGSLSIYGFGAAAREYFGKDISRLSLAEAAYLAGIIQRPAYYLSESHRDDALARRDHVLEAMTRLEMIGPEEVEKARRSPLNFQPRSKVGTSPVNAPYFIDYIQEQLADVFPGEDLAQAGYRIFTTIDMDLQRAATQALTEGLGALDREMSRRGAAVAANTVQAALVALDARSGKVLAMVGGRDYSLSQFNRATDAYRQPGSAIKPLVFTAALAEGEHEGQPITLANTYVDQPTEFEGGYKPGNFGEDYQLRPLTVREGFARSSNIVSVSLARDTGYDRVADMIQRFGLRRPPENAAIALGASEATPLEMASAFSTFANGGARPVPYGIERIEQTQGDALREEKRTTKQVISPEGAYLVLSAMQDVIYQPYGTGRAAAQVGGVSLAGKTGTSQRSDAWFGAFTPRIVCVVWVGFDDNRQLRMTGSHAALPIWVSFMKQVSALRPDLVAGEFERPGGLVELEIEPHTGLLASEFCPERRSEIFLPDRQVTEACTETILRQAMEPLPPQTDTESSPPDSEPVVRRGEPSDSRRRPARALRSE